MNASSIMIIVSIFGGVNWLIAALFCGRGFGDVGFVEIEGTDEKPGAHFADEHLNGLDDGLFEEFVLFWVGVFAISYADVILILGEECVAYAGQQHQADE